MMLAFLKKVFWWLVCFELILEVRCGDKKSDKEEQRLPTTRDKDSSRKKPLPDLNLPGRKSDYLSNSYDSKAHRIGSRLFKKGDFPSLNEAVSSTKMLLAEKRKKSNLKYAQKKKSLGIKPKNYHKPDYNSKSSRIKRKAQTILDDDNGISDPIVANQMADKFLKERNRYYYHKSALKKRLRH